MPEADEEEEVEEEEPSGLDLRSVNYDISLFDHCGHRVGVENIA